MKKFIIVTFVCFNIFTLTSCSSSLAQSITENIPFVIWDLPEETESEKDSVTVPKLPAENIKPMEVK